MKIAHLLKKCDNINESKKVYECENCNKLFNWTNNCYWYGSFNQLEFNKGNHILHFCSEKCKEEHQRNFNRNVARK